MFSLTSALPSTASAEALGPLFGGFIGNTARSDSSPAYTSGLRLSAFPDRSPPAGKTEVASQFSCMQFLSVPGVYDYAGPLADSRWPRRVCGLPLLTTGSTSRPRFSAARYPAHRCLYLRFDGSLATASARLKARRFATPFP